MFEQTMSTDSYAVSDDGKEAFEMFVHNHSSQLLGSGIPHKYWYTLYWKLLQEVYDAGDVFTMQQVLQAEDETSCPYWRVISTTCLSLEEPQHIYLIDHAWTSTCKDAHAALTLVPGLVERMAELMGLATSQLTREEMIDGVFQTMWLYNQTYSFGHVSRGSDDSIPKWYIMDEFGSRVRHSDRPTVRIAPFFNADTGLAYSVLWPIREMEDGDEVTRDYVHGQVSPSVREVKLLPWFPVDLTSVSFVQKEPGQEYFQSYRHHETLPEKDWTFAGLPADRSLKVFIEYQAFHPHLTHPRFELVHNPSDADILWYTSHFHQFQELSESRPSCLINQFPCESVLTVKDMLAIVARRAGQGQPSWLPVTYNLQTELRQFVSYFQYRQHRNLGNHWIIKPWNLARGLDTWVTKNLNQIIRLTESGPKVACKYIEQPVLFYRQDIQSKVKFDIRYLVFLTGVKPLRLYAYQVFWLRFANKPYSLSDLHDYERHFTVMNYVEGAETKLKQVHYHEFIPQFEEQNPGYKWQDVQTKILQMFKELFEAATSEPAPCGIAPSPQSRAMYAVDLMLEWETTAAGDQTIEPKICEVNFSPDCARACKYHPSFVNDVFSVLFLGDTHQKHVIEL
ncbi:tubulin--tyrosine ligase-like protein 12 [Physella acuta]|uniref:tubulin--tyrosine ligase-like protein 12 n=1 Tax=Physella acuta TaxID=109671 RepID=UPI0027DB86BC|nr:tubulin--tyrosine ligase-like protein 12 [Physella acuta]XP_059147125.1 tubulin--tyrosine ligase-like protein 12 [Physella acuta]XP_059147126.1 tubulin--tyrosine ligase-like protein 12 [Physella acuta]XP_059147127.1 tubulin--tyrosine ligase-like protein 12 [Physella acuta]XP_059147128.1 tubulin--tyrosine ligase-like protein 12 [Physella acuta]XP_059147129.1 tubulin--tyrosine ligase-like protein 12 [Physella acuta]XP_059147130.1 tubulin--tyrosine ligase-like protein 12 [Physella acuta]XP_0